MPSFNKFYEELVASGLTWASDDVNAALLTSSWTPDRTLDFYSELTNELASGDGYTTGGNLVLSKTVATAANILYLEAADPTWTFAASKSFQYLVFYKDTGTPATSALILYIDLLDSTLSGIVTVELNALGLLSFSDA